MPRTKIEDIEKFPQDNLVYFVEELSENKSLFVCNGDIIYASPSLPLNTDSQPSIKTDYLELCLGVNLQPVLLNGLLGDMVRYDFIRLFNSASEREKLAYLDICESHSKTKSMQTLTEFFYSVSLLFSTTPEKSKKSAIGLFGELSVIDNFLKYGKDVSARWQMNGVQSKYDFSFDQFNCEVKTTSLAEPIVPIKHFQLFNKDNNYLVFLHVEMNQSGFSVSDFANNLLTNSKCFNGLREQVVLEQRLLQIRGEDLHNPYQVVSIDIFYANSINPFPKGVPSSVTNITYNLNLLGADQTEIDYLCSILK